MRRKPDAKAAIAAPKPAAATPSPASAASAARPPAPPARPTAGSTPAKSAAGRTLAKPASGGAPAPRAVSAPAAKSKRPSNGAVKVGVVGCAGRMGQMLLKMLISAPGIVVVGGSERKGSIALGQDIGALAGADPLGISVGDDPVAAVRRRGRGGGFHQPDRDGAATPRWRPAPAARW